MEPCKNLRPWTTLGLAVAVLAISQDAQAGCDDVGIRVDGEVSPEWRRAIDGACAELATTASRDASARVRIGPIGRDLAIEVTLADGRFASRRLTAPDALRSTLEALLVVPVLVAEEVPTSSTTSTVWPRVEEEKAPVAAAAPPSLGVDLGAAVGGRVAAHGYLSLAPAGFAEFRIGSWLFGMMLRWDAVGAKSAPQVDVFEMETVAAGLLVGRRLALGFATLDAGLSPRIAVDTQTYELRGAEQSLSATDVRLGGFGRVALGRSAWRALVELDAELSPSRLRRVAQLDPLLPALPSWSAGLSLGILWAAP